MTGYGYAFELELVELLGDLLYAILKTDDGACNINTFANIYFFDNRVSVEYSRDLVELNFAAL